MAENVDNIDGTGGDDQLPPFLRKQVPITKSSGVIPPFLQKKEAAPTTQTTAPKYEEPTGPIGTVIPAYAPASNKPNSDIQGPKITVQPAKTVTTPVGLGFNTVIPTLKEDHQTQVDAASQRIHNEFKQIDPAVKSLLLDYKKQQSLANFQDQIQQKTGDMGAANIALQKAQRLLPAAAIKVGDDEVKDYKQAMLQDPALAREALYQQAKLHPDKAPKIAADVYLVDSKDRAQGANAKQILDNVSGIEKGDLTYPIWHGGAVTKPLGLVGSMAHGFKQREDQFKDYNFIADSSPEDVIKEMENRRNTPRNADEPIPVPTGLGGGFGGMVGSEGITMAKGAIPSLMAAGTGGTAEVVAPWVGAALTSPDFYKRGYANSFNQNYNDLRDEGKTPQDAYKTASDRAAFDAKADVALGAVMTAVGGKLGMNASEAKFSPGFMGAVKGVAKQMGESAPEAGALGIAGGSIQALKNLNSGKEISKDVAEAALTPIALHYGIGLIAGGAKLLHPELYKSAVDNISKQPEDLVNKTLGEQVESKLITPQQANDAHLVIEDKRAQQEVLLKKAKDIVAKGKVEGISAEPLQHAALNDPDAFNSHLQNIAEQAHDPKTADNTEEIFGKDLVNVAKQLYPHEDIQELIKNNRTQDLKEVDDEIKKLNPESEDYGSKKKELTDKKSSINAYYDDYGKHIDNINSPKIADNETETKAGDQADEVKTNGAAPSEPAPFSNQQKEAASGFIRQGLADGSIPKEYEGMDAHPEHVLNFIREGIANGKEADLEKEFGKDLLHLAKTENSYPLVKNTKLKDGFHGDNGNTIVDKAGNPLTVYHGSKSKFEDFDNNKISSQTDKGFYGKGHYFSYAEGDSRIYSAGKQENVNPYHVLIKKPLFIDIKDHSLYDMEIPEGHDGVVVTNKGTPVEFVVKENSQIKKTGTINHIDQESLNSITNKSKDNATGIESSTTLDVRQQTGDGEEMGSGNAGHQEPAGESETENKNQNKKEVVPSPEDNLPFRDEPEDESVTGIRNSITGNKIEEAGLTPALKEIKRTHQEVWDDAIKKVNNGYDPQVLLDKLKKNPRPLTDTEDALLLVHQVAKESQLDAINRDITEAGQKGDESELVELQLQKTKIKDDLQDIYDVDKAVGTANARGLSARQMVSDRKYSLVSMENEALALKEGKPLTKEEKEQIEKRYNDIKEARDKVQQRVAELEAENKELKAKKTVAAEKKKAATKTKKSKADYSQQRADIIQKMREDLLKAAKGGEGLTASVPFAAQLKAVAPHVAKLLKSFIDQGIDNLEEITKHIHDLLSPDIPGLTESHVHDLIAGEFNEPKPKGVPSKASEIKEEAKQMKYAVSDPKLLKLRADYQRQKEAWGDETRKAELEKRTAVQKVQDAFIKWQRASKLSGITTIAKLAMAAVTRLSTTPLEEAVGGVYSKGLPSVAARATGEGGFNLKAEAKAISSAFTQGMKDAADILSKKSRGQSDIESVFGKGGNMPPEAIGFFGQLHSATKAPVKRAAFERSLTKRIAANLKSGVDVSDPMVQSRIAIQAYKDANRSIFMQDNIISDFYRNFINSLEKSKKYPERAKAAATVLQWLIPFVKVPTNIVGEVGTNVAGVPIAAGKLLHIAFTKGMGTLTEDEADMIMRNLKKGSIGAGALLLGYFNPKAFGGYYQKYEKRDPADLKAGQARIFGQRIPIWLLESPIFQTMQLGATVRRVKDKIIKGEPQGLEEGVWAGALGLVEHEPLIDQPSRIAGAITDSKERKYFLGELAKATVVPAAVSNIAQWTDPSDTRKPGTIMEHVENGIPGLRENVPTQNSPKASGTPKKGAPKREKRR